MSFKIFLYKYILQWIPDSLWIRLQFRRRMGVWPNLKNPKTFNEKLQWLKLHDRNPLYTKLVDKYEVKKIVAEQIGEEYTIPTLGVWNKFDDIDFGKLPNQFVLKCTHDSGGLVVVKDKSKFDINAARTTINNCLKMNYYWSMREWPYKNVKPRIIAEKYMENKKEECLTDYKFFCFNGTPQIMYISKDKAKEPTTDFFDMVYNHLNIRMRDPNSNVIPPKPKNFEKMKSIAKTLAKDKTHIRIDFYCVDDKIYLGELTFFHMSGFSHIYPKEWELILGDWIMLEHDSSK